jgi:phage baseplate assembly protein W
MNLAFPYALDESGRTAQAGFNDHVRQLIKQVLFTSPGERVMRPNFGCGLLRLVFAPNSDTLATATQFLVKSNLQQWLSGIADIQRVDVSTDDAQLIVQVDYIVLRTRESRSDVFTR